MAIIKMKKTAQGEPQQAIMAALGTEFYTKHVIVVDEDVDIYDMSDVMWAIATRVRPAEDIFMVPNCKAAILDPTSDPETFTVTKMGIDATRKSNYPDEISVPGAEAIDMAEYIPGYRGRMH